MKKQLLIVIISMIIAIGAVLISFMPQIAFSGINGTSSTIWLLISETGSKFGAPVIIVICSILISLSCTGWKKRIITTLITSLFLFIIAGPLAKLNEHIIKEQFQFKRPYTFYLNKNYKFQIQEFYAKHTKDARKVYLNNFIGTVKEKIYTKVDKSVVEHWLIETGYSFPSGHSLNAFLIATLFGYGILRLYKKRKLRYMFWGLTFWAIIVSLSRVSVGAHSALDVSTGAVIGFLIGLFIIITGVVDKLLSFIPVSSDN